MCSFDESTSTYEILHAREFSKAMYDLMYDIFLRCIRVGVYLGSALQYVQLVREGSVLSIDVFALSKVVLSPLLSRKVCVFEFHSALLAL